MGRHAGQEPGEGVTGLCEVKIGGQGERLACRDQGRDKKAMVKEWYSCQLGGRSSGEPKVD